MADQKLTGRGGPGRNQGRKTNTEKDLPPARSATVAVKVEPDIAEWLKLNGGSKLHYEILRKAFNDALIV